MNSYLAETASKRRDKFHIISEITEISKSGALKTQIMYKANLSFAQLTEYLNLLMKIDILEKDIKSGREVYKATTKGIDFLQRYRGILNLLNENLESNNGIRTPPQNLLK